jgi:hypothetical protein
MSAVIEDKGDRVDAATRASGTPAREPPVAEPHESRAEPVRGLRERLRLPLMIAITNLCAGEKH